MIVPLQSYVNQLQYAQYAVLGLIAVLLLLSCAMTVDIFYTDLDNYYYYDSSICDSGISSPNIGWFCGIFGGITSIALIAVALCPCAKCKASGLEEPMVNSSA